MRTIPVTDIRDGGPVAHARLHRGDALALRDACLSLVPGVGALAAPVADALARRWLERSCSPYREEIAAVAEVVGAKGVYAINTSYEWGCTTRASEPGGLPRIRRTLDWPFHGLGRHVHVTLQSGRGGDFYNVTWPGAVGVLTAMAPGRFAGTINQAPLRRSLPHPHPALQAADIGRQAVRTWRGVRHMPAAHLLRLAFEEAAGFEDAVAMLAEVPVARPVLFTLCGTMPGEMCLIERTEVGARVHRGAVTVANDWQEPQAGWEPRGLGRDPRKDNRDRRACLAASDGASGFDWVAAPVLCDRTRLAVEMRPAEGGLEVLGYERDRATGVVVPATLPLSLRPA